MSGDPNGTYTFGYDADGNTTSLALNGSTQWNYAYDAENRLRTVTPSQSPGSVVYYTYNAMGSRLTVANTLGTFTQRSDGTGATSPLLWDGQQLHTPGMFSADDAGTNLYYEPDALGSTAGILNTAQSVKSP